MKPADPFETIVHEHYEPLFRFAMTLTRAESDARDLTQQTFYIWATKGHQLRDLSKVKAWLFTTLNRAFLTGQKRQDRFPHHNLDDVSQELPATSPELVDQADCSQVLPALAKVDEVYQAPVALYYLCDHSYKDIAVVLDVPIGTVKSRIARGIAQLRRLFSPMAAAKFISLWLTIYWIVAGAVQAELFSLAGSGTIAKNSSGDTTLPVGTPWTFEIIYDTAAPDLDFELTGSPVATFGRFTNTGAIPAVTFVHYQAANYEVTIDDPKDFDAFSEIDITLGRESEIDINLNAPGLFPTLGGGTVSFHADFIDGSHSDFIDVPPSLITIDALPTETSLGLESFEAADVSLLPAGGGVIVGGLTSLRLAPAPEPSTSAAAIIGGLGLLLRRRPRLNASAAGNKRQFRSSNER